MPRIRTIKPDFWTDSKTGHLTDRAKLLFLGLLNLADDYGVVRFDVSEFSAKLFPYSENPRECSRALAGVLTDEILPLGLAHLFAFSTDDEEGLYQYLWIRNFEKHQKVDKPGKPVIQGWQHSDSPKRFADRQGVDYSELSGPNSGSPREDSRALANIRAGSGSGSGSGRRKKNPSSPLRADGLAESNETREPPGFPEFWTAYPRKVGKGEARKVWTRLKVNGRLPEILAAIEEHKKSDQWCKDGGQYIPHPATWLRQERWDDSLKVETSDDDDELEWV